MSDIEIARRARAQPIADIARKLRYSGLGADPVRTEQSQN